MGSEKASDPRRGIEAPNGGPAFARRPEPVAEPVVSTPDAGDYDPTVAWKCCWREGDRACPAGGPLRHGRAAGAGFFRHTCYGHGASIDRDRAPAIYDACGRHAAAFQRVHGLESEPDWLRRDRLRADYTRSQRLADGRTSITSAVGNG